MNIVMKNWGKKTRQKFFLKNTRIGFPKNVGRNRLKKVRKKVFKETHEYCDQKWEEKKREKNFT